MKNYAESKQILIIPFSYSLIDQKKLIIFRAIVKFYCKFLKKYCKSSQKHKQTLM